MKLLPLLPVLLSAASLLGQQKPAPDTLTIVGAPRPSFVSAAAATSVDGTINWSALDETLQMVTQAREADQVKRLGGKKAATSVDGPCETATLTMSHVSGNVQSFDVMLRSAKAIYRARIVGSTEGFSNTNPSTLIRAEIMRALRTSVGFPSHGDVYVLYPIADFKIEGKRFCNAGPIPDFKPAIGDELMIFCYDQPNDTTGQFLPTREQQLIFERGGKLYASKPLRSDPELLRTTGLSEIERRAKAGRDDRSLR